MRNSFPHLSFFLLLAFTAGCATSVDMDSVNRRIGENNARIVALEEAQMKQDREAASSKGEKLQALQEEIEAIRKDFADSRWTVDDLTEKVESFAAYVEEVEQFMAQFRKRGGEIDKALEEMTNRIEADVRSLAEKLGKMLEEGSQ
jgi:predicted  nucleic acid-binding Zn-ribbon protein